MTSNGFLGQIDANYSRWVAPAFCIGGNFYSFQGTFIQSEEFLFNPTNFYSIHGIFIQSRSLLPKSAIWAWFPSIKPFISLPGSTFKIQNSNESRTLSLTHLKNNGQCLHIDRWCDPYCLTFSHTNSSIDLHFPFGWGWLLINFKLHPPYWSVLCEICSNFARILIWSLCPVDPIGRHSFWSTLNCMELFWIASLLIKFSLNSHCSTGKISIGFILDGV